MTEERYQKSDNYVEARDEEFRAKKKEQKTNRFASCRFANEQLANSLTFDCHQDQDDQVGDVDNDQEKEPKPQNDKDFFRYSVQGHDTSGICV